MTKPKPNTNLICMLYASVNAIISAMNDTDVSTYTELLTLDRNPEREAEAKKAMYLMMYESLKDREDIEPPIMNFLKRKSEGAKRNNLDDVLGFYTLPDIIEELKTLNYELSILQ